MNKTTLREVLNQLVGDGHLEHEAMQRVIANLSGTDTQPWFVRVLIGAGAWVASVLLMSFIFGLAALSNNETGFVVVGVALVLGGWLLRWKVDSDFSNQMSLAASFAGQAAIVFGIVARAKSAEVETAVWLLLSMNVLLLLVHPDLIHRFLSTFISVICVIALLYLYEASALICLVGPVLMLIYVTYVEQETRVVASGHDRHVRPVMSGVVSGAVGAVLLSGFYVVPELARDLSIYPTPWVSTVLLGAMLLYVSGRVWRSLYPDGFLAGRIAGYGLTIAIVIASLQAPGLMLALLITTVGAANGNRALSGSGVLLLAVFTGVFFYGIETSLWIKSITLMATGLVVLAGRWVLLALYRHSRGLKHA